MAWRSLTLMALVIASAALVSGQNDGPDNTCMEARTWHLQHALRYSEAGDQDYHLKAAQAADALGSGCTGWNEDVHAPDGDGDTRAESLDNLQAAQYSQGAQ